MSLSVFGATAPPGVYQLHNDGAPGITLGMAFTTYGGHLSGALCVGGRVWVPALAQPYTDTIRVMAWLGTDLSAAPVREKLVAVSGTGWVDALWDEPLAMPGDGATVTIGYRFAGGDFGPNHYVHSPSLRADASAVRAFGDVGLELRAAPSVFFRIGDGASTATANTSGHGVDILVDEGVPGNAPPIARAGSDKSADTATTVTLSGSTSSDPDGTVASYAWRQASGTPVTLVGTGPSRSFTAPSTPGVLTFGLTVTDNAGAVSDEDTVVVTVVQPPPEPEPEPSTPGGSLLSAGDLAFMRETQAEARPTEAELIRVTQGTSPSGGRVETKADPEPIQVRLDGKEKAVPNVVAAVVGSAKPVKVVMDMVEVRGGDIIRVNGDEYQVISGPDPDEWRTAQVVWTKRVRQAPRG